MGERMEEEAMAKGLAPVKFPFYLFAQRVAWGEAKPDEVAYMSAMADRAERDGDWDKYMNDYMA